MSESGFAKVTREGIERMITAAHQAGDSNLASEKLDIWPTGFPRPEISAELAHHIASTACRDESIYDQPTQEFPAIKI